MTFLRIEAFFQPKKFELFLKLENCGHMKMTQFVGRVNFHNV